MTSLISIIIPARHEAKTIGRSVSSAAAGSATEVIVVDGGSDDETAQAARAAGAQVITASPGRGGQMRAGVKVAKGDVFLFLHADAVLPESFADDVRAILSNHDVVAGAFRLKIDSPRRVFRRIERFVEWRSRTLSLPFGDQGLFVRARTYHESGGFLDIPIMEDYELVRRLRRRGRVVLADSAVLSSPRRWLVGGVVRTGVMNHACILAWHLGVSPSRIARWREMRPRRKLSGGAI